MKGEKLLCNVVWCLTCGGCEKGLVGGSRLCCGLVRGLLRVIADTWEAFEGLKLIVQ